MFLCCYRFLPDIICFADMDKREREKKKEKKDISSKIIMIH